ncbi:VOC family protein [Streptomyces sp. SID14478]|uniref:VOC family protein n=1 Tax=Streptomyces sp. SID14478 TaxID=2706073 RepID=UPI0013DAC281|nr:VOC family protein [Streptomyces sp. SID14478]NEB79601.1 VOC family protein [Streptomyces sp. SID14478]
MIKLAMTSVYVDDVAKAHAFYTDVLGFETRTHVDLGDGTLFVTVGAAGAQGDVELLLEPGQGPIAEPYRAALRAEGLPVVVFSVEDVAAEHERLQKLGVVFTQDPEEQGAVITAVLDDTVGNYVQLMQRAAA